MAAPDKDVTISWAHPIGTRDGTLATDAKMVNCFTEKTENGIAIVKRPGTQYISTITGTPQGQFSYQNSNFFIVNDTIYPLGSSGAGVALPGVTAAGRACFFISSTQAGAPQTTIQNDEGQLWTFNGTAATLVTDANYLSAQVGLGMAYLDGVYYAMRLNGQVIGSAINDPTTWPALDFAQADVTYGAGVALVRHLNYVLAFYDKGLQVFWDANAAPNTQGIALLPVLNASFRTGCLNARTITEIGDSCFFMSHNLQFGRQIQMMTGLQLQVISTPFVEKILSQPGLQEQDPRMWSFGITIDGHQFYGLTIQPFNVTLVYDITNQVWNLWSSVVGGVEQYFTGRFYLENDNPATQTGDFFQDVSTGREMQMLPTLYVDATGPIPVTCVTPNYDWGTLNWKRFTAMFQQADTVTTTIGIAFSDDDYQTFSTPRTMSLQFPLKQLRNCGSSRRRAWKMTHSDATSLRLYDVKAPVTVANR